MYLEQLLVSLKRILILLGTYSLLRLLFLLFNLKEFSEAGFTDVAFAFFLGLRFDLSSVCLINSLVLLLSLLPFDFALTKKYQLFLRILSLVINTPFIFLNLIDLEFFKFTGRRTTFNIVGIADDVRDQSFQLLYHYWYITLIGLVFIFILFKSFPFIKEVRSKKTGYALSLVYILLAATIAVYAIRGGWQVRPLSPNNAFALQPSVLGNLVMNSSFSFIASATAATVEKVDYYANDRDMMKELTPNSFTHQFPNTKDNVVIIILESFNKEHMGIGHSYKGYTPFLDSLASASYFFKNNFSNGLTSVDAAPSILASIPFFSNESYITSRYQSNTLYGLGKILGYNGYTTAFFHGGKNGTMGFDGFTARAGFEHYYGINEYYDYEESEENFDGTWGIFDEPFLQFSLKRISEFKEPFGVSIFTLSSHQPYTIPKQYKNKFPKGDMFVHETVGYADYSLKKFFEAAKKTSWYKNTIFIVTADHVQDHFKQEYQNSMGDFSIPLIIYHPSKKLPLDTSKVTQQLDIMPTIINYLGIKTNKLLPFGHSIFNDSRGMAINFYNQSYRLITKDYFLELSPQGESTLYSYYDWSKKNPITDKEEIRKSYEEKLKAYIQYYKNGMMENNWYKLATEYKNAN